MSQGFHHGIFSFPNGFGRSPETVDSQALAAQQRRREGLRVQGFEQGEVHISESAATAATMLSDMFDFPPAGGNCAADLLANQIPINYRVQRPSAAAGAAAFSGNWYTPKPQGGDSQQNELTELNADSVAAMHLFLMNPPQSQQRAPPHHLHSFQSPSFVNESFRGGGMEGQGLSLSLSSSLQQLEMAQQVGYVGSVGMGNMIRHPKYAKATQELLQEFCSVGMGLLKKGKKGKHFGSLSTEPNPSSSNAVGGSTAGTAAAKEPPPLSPAERFEHQRRKAKLISILYEVDRRYSHYTEKMQAMVSSFDSAMGFGAAAPYTGLARRAMSRHFRCLKDAIAAQLKHVGRLLGEKEGSGPSAITKGETPRLRLVDQILRQQRTFNQYGVVEQESWRPQRGLPERSVNVLRAWLFEHFLHPYPSDADKHFLARQTGLSRSQVSNWFINARVRLWKPMVEEMYQREANEATEAGEGETAASESTTQPQPRHERPEDMAGGTGLPHPQLASLNRGGVVGDVSAAVVGAEAIMSGGEDGVRVGILEDYGAAMAVALERTGTSGDVSLTLGLRHAGSTPASGRFTLADFGGC